MGYHLYRGEHGPDSINWSLPIGIASSGVAEVPTYEGLPWTPGKAYWLGLRAVSDAEVEEEGTRCICRVVIAADGSIVGPPPVAAAAGAVTVLAGGYLRAEVTLGGWENDPEAVAAASLRLAEVPAAGAAAIDWDEEALATLTVHAGVVRYRALLGPWADGTVRLAARTYAADGTAGPVLLLPPAVADATGPAAVAWLDAQEVTA
ncbi:MAG: hypothetical protein GX591_20555 [Planctomycetes bacterium]|nr:hypothetical protein [Planctomycetota bacterium]